MISVLEQVLLWLTAGLTNIPATFWGVLFGSFFTLFGGYITNRATDRRQRAQFQHDQTLKREERELAIRRDIYFAASDAIQEGVLILGYLANLDMEIGEVSKAYVGKASAISKIQLIARGETLRAVSEATAFLRSSVLQLTTGRMPLDSAKQQMALAKAEVAGFEKERDRWLEQMKQYNLDGSSRTTTLEHTAEKLRF